MCERLEKPPAVSDAREGTVSRFSTSDLSAAPRPARLLPAPPPSLKRDFRSSSPPSGGKMRAEGRVPARGPGPSLGILPPPARRGRAPSKPGARPGGPDPSSAEEAEPRRYQRRAGTAPPRSRPPPRFAPRGRQGARGPRRSALGPRPGPPVGGGGTRWGTPRTQRHSIEPGRAAPRPIPSRRARGCGRYSPLELALASPRGGAELPRRRDVLGLPRRRHEGPRGGRGALLPGKVAGGARGLGGAQAAGPRHLSASKFGGARAAGDERRVGRAAGRAGCRSPPALGGARARRPSPRAPRRCCPPGLPARRRLSGRGRPRAERPLHEALRAGLRRAGFRPRGQTSGGGGASSLRSELLATAGARGGGGYPTSGPAPRAALAPPPRPPPRRRAPRPAAPAERTAAAGEGGHPRRRPPRAGDPQPSCPQPRWEREPPSPAAPLRRGCG